MLYKDKSKLISYVSNLAFSLYIFAFIMSGITFILIENKHNTLVYLFFVFMCIGGAFVTQYLTKKEFARLLNQVNDN